MILGSYVISWLFHTFPCFVLQDFVQPTRRMAKEGLVDQRNFTALPLLCASQAGGVAPWALKYVTRWIAVSTCYHKMLPQVIFHHPNPMRFPVVASSVPQCSTEMIQQLLKLRTLLLDASLDSSSPLWSGDLPSRVAGVFFPRRSWDRREWNAQIFAAFFSSWLQESSSAQIASVKLLLFKTSKLTFKDYFRSSTYTEQSVFWRMGRACSSWMVSPNVIDTCKDSSEGARPHIHTFNDRLVSLGSVVLR